jgi:hypothetical protein
MLWDFKPGTAGYAEVRPGEGLVRETSIGLPCVAPEAPHPDLLTGVPGRRDQSSADATRYRTRLILRPQQ